MENANGSGQLCAGIDYREKDPRVCYWNSQMKEPQELPLDFGEQAGHVACLRRILSALKRYGKKQNIRAAIV